MPWVADFHIHSHFSMATSQECNPRNLHRWAGLKGVSVVGTGDFTHPGWRKELREELMPAEPGFYRLKHPPAPEIPNQPEVRFVVTGELSTIYKKNGRVRKVHHLIIVPSLEEADRIAIKLETKGMNIRSDGRPILGLDSYNLLALVLEQSPNAIFIPAHIWTPHFSVFGSNSGFEEITECYGDLTERIFALETGLSSNPEMNWRWSALDRFTLVSNSDAHNPQNLAREANLFETEFTYQGICDALRNKPSGQFLGTLEFFPEEGKYHLDGHRNCEVCWKPEETKVNHGICSVCGKKVTVGVLHRVEALADRPAGFRPAGAKNFTSLVPLREVIGSAINRKANTRQVEQLYFNLLHQFGPELTILGEIPLADLAKKSGPLIAEGIRRIREGQVAIKPGYDGEYGVISVLREDDRQALLGQASLLENPGMAISSQKKKVLLRESAAGMISEARSLLTEKKTASKFASGSSPEQEAIINTTAKKLAVVAGPGTGKTKTLVERIVQLLRNGADPTTITAVTFTNKAAIEIKQRILSILPGDRRVSKLNLGTFHGICWKILNQNPERTQIKLIDDGESRSLLEEALRRKKLPITTREASLVLTLLKNKYLWEEEINISPAAVELYEAYQESLRLYNRWDFDDIIPKTVELWEEDPTWLRPHKKRFGHVLVDEFQDLCLIQYQLFRYWAKEAETVMVIGDPNQSIYGFRGSSATFFESFQRDFPESVSKQLSENYRCQPIITEAANYLISPAYRQKSASLATGEIPKIIWYETPNEKGSCKAITAQIVELLGGSTMLSAHGQRSSKNVKKYNESYGLSDIAILYRTARQAEGLEMALNAEGLPFRVVGSTNTLETTAVKEFLNFFRYLYDAADLFLLRTVLRSPRWALTGREISKVIELLAQRKVGLLEEQLEYLSAELDQETGLKLRQFFGVAQYYRGQLTKVTSEIITDWMLRMDSDHLEELEQLKKLSEDYRSLADFIERLPLNLEADLIRRSNKATGTEMITLSTLHAAKGLEFPVVFITGVEEGLIPYGSETSAEGIAEEQRLLYVGLTRAKHQLYLVSSKQRFRSGETIPVEPSRFLELIPQELIEKIEWVKQNRDQQLELFS